MKQRIGDRRGSARFEIVGSLIGTLETWERFRLINLSPGGALIEASAPLPLGTSRSARLAIAARTIDAGVTIRRVANGENRADGMRYLVGVEWTSRLPENDTLFSAQPLIRRSIGAPSVERRRSVRVAAPERAEVSWPNWATVQLMDVSASGVMFSSPVALQVGGKGHLRMRIGDRGFAAQVEIQREAMRPGANAARRLGARFASLDEASRLALDTFIGDAGDSRSSRGALRATEYEK